jgi:HSP20 family protein
MEMMIPNAFSPGRGGNRRLERMLRDLNRVLESPSAAYVSESPAGVYPLMNVSQDGENFYVCSEIPGVNMKDLDVSVTGRSLTVSGERQPEVEDPKVRYHRKERQSGKFRRQFNLPTDLEVEKVQAQYRHGILMLVLPKAESAKPKKVAISG